jgi:DNA-binding MarR family transcriptional regulator
MGQALMQRLSQSKPLADPLEEAAVNLLLAGAWLEERLDRVLAPLGITHAQYNVLRILRGAHPGGHPRGEIGRRMIDRAPDVTRLIDRLKQRGLVERARGTDDRRQSITRITRKGQDVLAQGTRAFAEVNRDLAERLNRADCRELSRLCEAIYGADLA